MPESELGQSIDNLCRQYDAARTALLEHSYHNNRDGNIPDDYLTIVNNYYKALEKVQEFGLKVKPEMQRLQSEQTVDNLEDYLNVQSYEAIHELGKKMIPEEFHVIRVEDNHISTILKTIKPNSPYPFFHFDCELPGSVVSKSAAKDYLYDQLVPRGVTRYEDIKFTTRIDRMSNCIDLRWITMAHGSVDSTICVFDSGLQYTMDVVKDFTALELSIGMVKKVYSLYKTHVEETIERQAREKRRKRMEEEKRRKRHKKLRKDFFT